ncbi:MAG TPA: matrixin family metalloprotease [Candidatus Nanoarchaeia archaeon]|nr:matrixin family metalloprotease [Candidatus Nanoarchaeia archaeon]
MKRYLGFLALLVLSSILVFAGIEQKPDRMVKIPKKAVEVEPGVFYLGRAMDSGRVVEGYALVHYKEAKTKPGANSCYSFLASGARWKNIEPYMVLTDNSRGLDSAFINDNLALDISKWETAAQKEIIGERIEGLVDGINMQSPDNKNEVLFGSISEPGAIAITVVWGVFGGNPRARMLSEWDQVYDDVDFDWSSSGHPDKMDFESLATHELGHSVGLGDLYNSACAAQTMYGYASVGEINKRSLESGDIKGVQTLYN